MKTGAGLALIAIGAILAFAVKGSPSWLNLHIAGWVIMIVGLAGLLLPRRTYGWLGRRMQVRRTYPSGQVQQVPVSPYATRNPGAQPIEAGLSPRPTLLDDQDGDPREQAVQPSSQPGYVPAQGTAPMPGNQTPVPGNTEVIEDLYEQP